MVIAFTPGREDASYIRHSGGAPANVAIPFPVWAAVPLFAEMQATIFLESTS
jgi:hypothetical protein